MPQAFNTLQSPQIPAGSPNAASIRWILAALSLPTLMASLDTSIAHAALPLLAASFEASFAQVQWIVLAYLLALTTVIVSVGRLGDLLGRRRLLLTGIGVFTIASLLCGIAPSLEWLIAARAAQGIGAAVMMALTLAMAGDIVPIGTTGRTMGLLGTMSAIGTAFGPSLGGVLTSGLGWRAIFLVNLPVGVLTLVLAWRHLPADGPRADRAWPRFDSLGMSLLAATLSAYALAITRAQHSFGPMTIALLVGSFLGLGLFIRVEMRTPAPLIALDAFRAPLLSAGLAMSVLVAAVMMSTLVVGPFYLSRALGLHPAVVGLVLSIGPLVVALSGVPAGGAADRFGTARVTRAGLTAMMLGSLLLCLAPAALGLLGYIVPIVVLTAGYALFQTSNSTAIMSGVKPEQRGVTSGLLNLSRNLGLITGASVMGGVFALATGNGPIAAAPPAAVAMGMRTTFGVAAALMTVALALSAVGRVLHTTHPQVNDAASRVMASDAAACLTPERK